MILLCIGEEGDLSGQDWDLDGGERFACMGGGCFEFPPFRLRKSWTSSAVLSSSAGSGMLACRELRESATGEEVGGEVSRSGAGGTFGALREIAIITKLSVRAFRIQFPLMRGGSSAFKFCSRRKVGYIIVEKKLFEVVVVVFRE